MEIQRMILNDWEKYKKIRLEALRKNPEAFGSSYDEAIEKTDAQWKESVENPKNYIFAACDGEEWIGMMAAYQEKGSKMKHIGYVWGVYMRDTYRGQKIGKKLMQVLLDELRQNKEIEKLNLNVNTEMVAATKMYQSFGFEITGTSHKEMKIDDRYIDEYAMEIIF
jgi:ribosomal protein S18 acetylase RimI-like enzyme